MNKNIKLMNIEIKKLEKLASYDQNKKFRILIIFFLGFLALLTFFMIMFSLVYSKQKTLLITFGVVASLSFLLLVFLIGPFCTLLASSKWMNLLMNKKPGENIWSKYHPGNLSITFNLFIGILVFNMFNGKAMKITKNERKVIESVLLFH
ncbi:hypothetical protein MBOVJF4428_00646 [Mycoplasmopsis agalactiae]|uniref:Uncharacterized protein n=1 Tax=Mycoplasmopsis agalactiae (strain NCTC 10123 / CIP 59.7 / PG2) TaxID=347257 RepID=A5IXF1_MYCAP|nr:hypothetical protein [Mycoplasmopsis agalactiae]MCE6056823.1 hypothetical protein [Mycoplasmopsis agalactiae]MCE6078611.1 hypothetical protein [Mycoplasmopsis agalactiae]MCE6094996.1 hypothetical protein [Mycoplasmopsis agalactiae]MCE6114253.1 hypothetical protein [Mycoplasmopsis agalactiae]NLS34587.1 hypothetical protein [Mycoplasmopsis agalactiae]